MREQGASRQGSVRVWPGSQSVLRSVFKCCPTSVPQDRVSVARLSGAGVFPPPTLLRHSHPPPPAPRHRASSSSPSKCSSLSLLCCCARGGRHPLLPGCPVTLPRSFRGHMRRRVGHLSPAVDHWDSGPCETLFFGHPQDLLGHRINFLEATGS